MSTRGRIAVEVTPDEIDYIVNAYNHNAKTYGEDLNMKGLIGAECPYISVYHHSDSYPNALGKELFENYTERKDVIDLMIMGDLSCIWGDFDDDYNFDGKVKSYLSWRGESAPPIFSDTLEDLNRESVFCDADFLYVFNKDNQWEFSVIYSKDNFRGLKKLTRLYTDGG